MMISMNGRRRPGRLLALAAVFAATHVTWGQNLLHNPGFEGEDGFELPPDSCPAGGNYAYHYNCIQEVIAPTWWFPFWNDGVIPHQPENHYRRPEFKVIPNEVPFLDPPRIFEGYRACQYFGMWGAIDAGYYQQVAVTPGQIYRFSYWAHAWSSCEDDAHHSGQGCGSFPDDQVTFQAGIDPTGQIHFVSPSIVWGDGAHIYDAYEQVPAVDAFTDSDTITVFMRSVYLWGYKHNDSYLDAAELVCLGPPIVLSTNVIERTAAVGGSLSDDTFTVANGGSGTIHYNVGKIAPWFSVWPTSGSSSGAANPVDVLYDVDELDRGEHTAYIWVTATDAGNSPQTITVTVTIENIPGDFDSDDDVDQQDFGHLQACLTGPGGGPPASGCEDADLDDDTDVDQDDFAMYQACVSGANVQADPACAG